MGKNSIPAASLRRPPLLNANLNEQPTFGQYLTGQTLGHQTAAAALPSSSTTAAPQQSYFDQVSPVGQMPVPTRGELESDTDKRRRAQEAFQQAGIKYQNHKEGVRTRQQIKAWEGVMGKGSWGRGDSSSSGEGSRSPSDMNRPKPKDETGMEWLHRVNSPDQVAERKQAALGRWNESHPPITREQVAAKAEELKAMRGSNPYGNFTPTASGIESAAIDPKYGGGFMFRKPGGGAPSNPELRRLTGMSLTQAQDRGAGQAFAEAGVSPKNLGGATYQETKQYTGRTAARGQAYPEGRALAMMGTGGALSSRANALGTTELNDRLMSGAGLRAINNEAAQFAAMQNRPEAAANRAAIQTDLNAALDRMQKSGATAPAPAKPLAQAVQPAATANPTLANRAGDIARFVNSGGESRANPNDILELQRKQQSKGGLRMMAAVR